MVSRMVPKPDDATEQATVLQTEWSKVRWSSALLSDYLESPLSDSIAQITSADSDAIEHALCCADAGAIERADCGALSCAHAAPDECAFGAACAAADCRCW